jgi:hypothetical protein
MIRRGFWLVVGAAGGIMGYRRVSSIGRQLSATLSTATATPTAPAAGAQPERGRARRGLVRGTIRLTRDTRMFSRDVREGMDLYMVRHRAPGSPTLGAGAQSRRPPAPPSFSEFSEVPGAPTANDERVKDDR